MERHRHHHMDCACSHCAPRNPCECPACINRLPTEKYGWVIIIVCLLLFAWLATIAAQHRACRLLAESDSRVVSWTRERICAIDIATWKPFVANEDAVNRACVREERARTCDAA